MTWLHNQMTILGPRFLNEKLDGGDPLNKHDIFQVKATTSSILKGEKKWGIASMQCLGVNVHRYNQ